jgi:hypothetical protein
MHSPTPHFQPFPEISFILNMQIETEKSMPFEIVHVDARLFKKGVVMKNESDINQLKLKRRDEYWLPGEHEFLFSSIAPDEIQFTKDAALIRLIPIGENLDGVGDAGLDFCLGMQEVSELIGSTLILFASIAWKLFKINSPFGDEYPCKIAYNAVFELNNGFPNTLEPIFRGFLPRDERLAMIAITEDHLQD